jgi:hypothetical protein
MNGRRKAALPQKVAGEAPMSESKSEASGDIADVENAPKIVPSLSDMTAAAEPAPSVAPDPDMKPWAATAGASIVGILGLTSVVAAVLAAMAFSQLNSVKADVASSREELMLAQERTTRLERQLEKALQSLEQQAQLLRATEHTGSVKEARAEPAAPKLSPEEVLLVRSYIKASPVTTAATGTISIGEELRDVRMLPLPSQIAARSSRLAGGRFKIDRNGAIVISLRKSNKADAIIQPN